MEKNCLSRALVCVCECKFVCGYVRVHKSDDLNELTKFYSLVSFTF